MMLWKTDVTTALSKARSQKERRVPLESFQKFQGSYRRRYDNIDNITIVLMPNSKFCKIRGIIYTLILPSENFLIITAHLYFPPPGGGKWP